MRPILRSTSIKTLRRQCITTARSSRDIISQTGVPTESWNSDDGTFTDSQLFHRSKHANNQARQVGSKLSDHYKPRQNISHPPRLEDASTFTLMAAQAHLGHATSLWNPATQPYVYGIRQGIHIIYLDTTMQHLRRASNVVREVAKRGGIIVIIGTRKGQERSVVEAAKRVQGYHVFDRWIPGSITNGLKVFSSGELAEFEEHNDTQKRVLKESEKFLVKPDLVIVLNPLENRIALKECAQNRIPSIAIIDTDADPAWTTYPIPANDDSLRCTSLIAGILARAGEDGRRLRKQ